MIAWFHKIAPPSVEKRMILVMDNLKYAVGGYFKAQFKIMGVVFLILFAGFLVLGIHYAVLVAFLISFWISCHFWNGNCVDSMGNLLRIYR